MDASWLKILDLSPRVMAGLLIASVSTLVAKQLGYIELAGLPEWVTPIVWLVAIFSAALTVINVVSWVGKTLVDLLRTQKKKNSREQRIRSILSYLDSLSAEEHEILSYMVEYDQRSITATAVHPVVSMLKQKGLLITTPGTWSMLNVPYLAPDYVWAELQRRKVDFRYYANFPPDLDRLR